MEIFCSMPISLQSLHVNFDVNLGSWSLMILLGNPKCVTTCCRYNAAVPSALISSIQGKNMSALVQLWLVIVRIESYPCDTGSLVIKLIATVSNGMASIFG